MNIKSTVSVIIDRGPLFQKNLAAWENWCAFGKTIVINDETTIAQCLHSHSSEYSHVFVCDSRYAVGGATIRSYLIGLVSRCAEEYPLGYVFEVGPPSHAPKTNKTTSHKESSLRHGGLFLMNLEQWIRSNEFWKPFDPAALEDECVKLNFRATTLTFPFRSYILASKEPEHIVDRCYESVRQFYPEVKVIRTNKNIYEAHQELAARSLSPAFLVIDADHVMMEPLEAEVFTAWDFKFNCVWYAFNPCNGLVYGHGGPKIFSTNAMFAGSNDKNVDVTQAVSLGHFHMRVIKKPVGIHAYTWSKQSAYRTAFRETAKLFWRAEDMNDDEARDRLRQWLDLTKRSADSVIEACDNRGAADGYFFASTCKKADRIKINDYDWLDTWFAEIPT